MKEAGTGVAILHIQITCEDYSKYIWKHLCCCSWFFMSWAELGLDKPFSLNVMEKKVK